MVKGQDACLLLAIVGRDHAFCLGRCRGHSAACRLNLWITIKQWLLIRGNVPLHFSLQLQANYIQLKCRNEGVYQYAVAYNPTIDSCKMRFKMMEEHVDVTGAAKAFDGAILFLPIRLPQQVSQANAIVGYFLWETLIWKERKKERILC